MPLGAECGLDRLTQSSQRGLSAFFYLHRFRSGFLRAILAIKETGNGSAVDFHPEVTRVFHQEVTLLKVMFCGLCWGQDMRGLPFRFGYR